MSRVIAASALILLWMGVAHADRREASLHLHLVSGLAMSTYSAYAADLTSAASRSGSAPLGGLAVRGSYATHNRFQYDAALTLLSTGGTSFGEATFKPPTHGPVTGPFTVASQIARLDAGVTLRFGVRVIPTLRLAAGVQARRQGSPTVSEMGEDFRGQMATGRGSELGADLVGGALLGLDYRVNRRLIVGAAAGATYAVPLGGEAFRTMEITVHVARYFYPRWW